MQGLYTALITPFDDRGKIDYSSFDKIIEWQLKAGVDGLVPCGTTGESPTLSLTEHKEVIAYVTKKVDRRAKILAGSGSNNTKEAIELSLYAKEVGVDACLLVTPYYNKPTQEGLYQHFKTIAKEVKMPCVLYNVPGRTSLRIEVDTIRRLAEIEFIVGVKDAVGDIDFTSETLSQVPKHFISLTGTDNQIYSSMMLGGHGAVSVLSNVVPQETKNLIDVCLKGDFKKAQFLHFKLWPLANSLFLETNPIPIKMAMYLLRLTQSPCTRLPLTEANPQTTHQLKRNLSDLGIVFQNSQ